MDSEDTNPYKTPESSVADQALDVDDRRKIPNKRVCAFLIDLVVLALIEGAVTMFSEVISMIVGSIYLLFRDAIFDGRSVGKRIAGIKTVDEAGDACTPVKSLLRNVILIPLMWFPLALLIEYFVMRFSAREKRLGDMIAKTVVVDLRPETSDSIYILYSIGVIIGMFALTFALFWGVFGIQLGSLWGFGG